MAAGQPKPGGPPPGWWPNESEPQQTQRSFRTVACKKSLPYVPRFPAVSARAGAVPRGRKAQNVRQNERFMQEGKPNGRRDAHALVDSPKTGTRRSLGSGRSAAFATRQRRLDGDSGQPDEIRPAIAEFGREMGCRFSVTRLCPRAALPLLPGGAVQPYQFRTHQHIGARTPAGRPLDGGLPPTLRREKGSDRGKHHRKRSHEHVVLRKVGSTCPGCRRPSRGRISLKAVSPVPTAARSDRPPRTPLRTQPPDRS